VKKTAGTAATKTWIITASGCTVPTSATFSMQVLEYDTWTSLTSSTFDADYTSYFSLAGSALTGTFTYQAPANSLMKQLPEKIFKFKLAATATFGNPNNCGTNSCYCHNGSSCAWSTGSCDCTSCNSCTCNCGNTCACTIQGAG
jgi:hypothetical protein